MSRQTLNDHFKSTTPARWGIYKSNRNGESHGYGSFTLGRYINKGLAITQFEFITSIPVGCAGIADPGSTGREMFSTASSSTTSGGLRRAARPASIRQIPTLNHTFSSSHRPVQVGQSVYRSAPSPPASSSPTRQSARPEPHPCCSSAVDLRRQPIPTTIAFDECAPALGYGRAKPTHGRSHRHSLDRY